MGFFLQIEKILFVNINQKDLHVLSIYNLYVHENDFCHTLTPWPNVYTETPLEGAKVIVLKPESFWRRLCFPSHCKSAGCGWGSPRSGKMTIITVPRVYIAPFFN